HINHRTIPDGPVDRVRGRVGQVGKEKAEAPTPVQQQLAYRRRDGAGVATAAVLRRRVDRADAHAIGGGTAVAGERDEPTGVLPEVEDTRAGGQGIRHPARGIQRLAVAQRLVAKGRHPALQQVAVGLTCAAQLAWYARHRDHGVELVDALIHAYVE